MTSQRHKSATRADADDRAAAAIPDDILDATRAAVLAVGVRRTTLTDVSRRAGVSRMTLYRLVPDVTTLILEVMTRDLGHVMATAEAEARRRRTGRARLVAVVLGVQQRLPREPLLRRVLDVDPELLLPYLTERWGSTQRLAAAHVRRMVLEGQSDGSVRKGDAEVIARMLILLVTPYVVGSRDVVGGADTAVTAELERMIDRWLAP